MWLKASGVSPLLVGKFLNGYPGKVPPSWDYFASSQGDQIYHGFKLAINGKSTAFPSTVYSTVKYTDLAIEEIKKQEGKDFFLWLSFHAPHVPSTPENKYKNAFAGAKVPRFPVSRQISPSHDAAWRKQLQTLASVDDQIKRIVDTLTTLGELDETYIIVMPDNGWQPGGYNGLGRTKSVPFDWATKIGLFVRGPGVGKGENNDLISNADVGPTIAALLGASVPGDVDGRPFASVLTGGSHARQVMPLFHSGSAGKYPGYHGLRTKNLLYVERADGVKLLFDSTNDPWQEKNIYASATADLKKRLADRTALLAKCKAKTYRDLEDKPL